MWRRRPGGWYCRTAERQYYCTDYSKQHHSSLLGSRNHTRPHLAGSGGSAPRQTRALAWASKTSLIIIYKLIMIFIIDLTIRLRSSCSQKHVLEVQNSKFSENPQTLSMLLLFSSAQASIQIQIRHCLGAPA